MELCRSFPRAMARRILLGTLIGLFLFIYNASATLECVNRTNDLTLILPSVTVDDASDYDPPDNNGSVVLVVPEEAENAKGWLGLTCSHAKAVRWVYNLDPEISLTTFSLTRRSFDDFYDVKTYKFSAEVEIKVLRTKQEFIFACVSFDNPCERQFVKVFQNDEQKYVIKIVSKAEENQPLVQELEHQLTINSFREKSESDPCKNVTFAFEDSKNKFSYGFSPNTGLSESHKSFADRQELENVYLYQDHLDYRCTKKCDGTCRFTTAKEERAWYWPSYFYKKIGRNVSRVVHMYHTLRSLDSNEKANNGQMKFTWEYSNPNEFIVMEDLPETVFAGTNLSINCRMSPFLFSFGARTGFTRGIKENKITILPYNDDIETGNEPTDLKDARVQSTVFTVPPTSGPNDIVTVYCFAPIWNSSTEWVNVSRQFEIINPTIEFLGEDKRVFKVPLKSQFNTSCEATGQPLPELTIELPRNLTGARAGLRFENSTGNTISRITLKIESVDESHAGVYTCKAENPKGVVFQTFEIGSLGLKLSDNSLSTVTISLISVFASICAIFIFIALALLLKLRLDKQEFKRLTDEAVREFLEGIDESQIPNLKSTDQPVYANDSVKALPYNKAFEVHHKHWSFSGTMLGSGAFGEVRKGIVEIGTRKSLVAIKTLKSTDDIADFRATLLELKILSTIGHHQHIIKLIAASTNEMHNRKVLIGVELCSNGDLLSYLRKRKKLFTNMVKDGKIQFRSDHSQGENESVPQLSENEEGMYENLVVTSDISTIDLYKWSFQIASGMDFLESKKVLHADLAARNVLLTETLLVKISDFGLSRELYENSEYVKRNQAVLLPFKWMAVESLKYLKFSVKSDVWSYGVTLYEIFTLGEEPYPGQTWNEEFTACLENGMRLERPQFGTDNMYATVMTQCWLSEPNERIRCADAMAFFEKAMGFLTSSPRNTDHCRDFC